MRCYVVHEHGDLDALQAEQRPDPTAGAGEALVRVHACGVNRLDLWVRQGVPGHRFPLPLIPGNDIAGTVVELGPGCARAGGVPLGVGAEVLVAPGVSCGVCAVCHRGQDHHCRRYGILGEHRDGGYAELVCVPVTNLLPKPARLSFVEAASIGVAFLTAWNMLVHRARLQPGETLLVHAGGSGVGSAAIQIAGLIGASTIATASTVEKRQRAKALGATHVLPSREAGLSKEVRRLTHNTGVQVVFEHVGAATWEESLRCLAWQGRLVTCGATTGAEAALDLRHLFFKSLSILGATMGSRGDLWRILELFEQGSLHPLVHRTMPLEDCRAAHHALQHSEVFGKIVLSVGGFRS